MKPFFALTLLVIASVISGCGGSDNKAERGQMPVGNASSPTEAYKMLFSAVKSKDSENIKTMMSKSTVAFAESRASQTNKPLSEILKNGFSTSTMGESLPQIRDEQISNQFGMIEVYDAKAKMWQMLPFINEEGGWKLAVGDAFADTWKQPGKTQTQKEMENSNMSPPQMMPGANVDFNKIQPVKIDPKAAKLMRGPNPTLGNVKPQRIPTH